jgi:anoctamin-1
VHSSMKFPDGDEDDDEVFEEVTKTGVDMHFHINEMQNGHDVADYPQNPYGQHETKNHSLFFEDETRSIDFVLVWKKLVPHDDDERSDALKSREIEEIDKKESDRAARREVFEENLINEGLNIERTVVDEEITFIKIHAPLEVLRRYAEILKLRLPMKEVSQIIFN